MTPDFYFGRRGRRTDEDDRCDCCALTAEDAFPCSCREPEEISVPEPQTCPVCRAEAEAESKPAGNCCCKASMADALHLLCGSALGSLVDFDTFFFLTGSLAVGSALATPGGDPDNITAPAASLRRFSPCNCDLLEVAGTAYFSTPDLGTIALDAVDLLSVCAVKAVAFQIRADDPDEADDGCCNEPNYRKAVRAIRRAIRAQGGETSGCAGCAAHCDCDDCCCTDGVVSELSTRNLSRLATLSAGPLVLRNVTVLGSLGPVLVLASEDQSRFYLVCANAVEAMA